MKKIFTLFLIFIAILLSVNTNAQINRANNKKSVAYKANYQRIATNGSQTFEIREGTLWAWGENTFGQLGDGTITQRNSPVQIGTDNKWVSIAVGNPHTLGLKSDGTLWAWGDNRWGQLGDGTTIQRNSPVQIGTDDNWISIAAGEYHSLGLKSDGSLWAWGRNIYGELGDGTTTDKNSPVQIGTDTKWVSIASSWHSLGLKSDGTLWAWGRNNNGELGDGTTNQRNSPVQIGTDNNWISISAGLAQNLALKSGGSLWAWGYNNDGELGDGTTTQRNSPVQIGTDNTWVGIAAGAWHSHGVKSNGTLWAWGDNFDGELGDGINIPNQFSPVQIGTDNRWVSVVAGDVHALGLKSDGTLWAWGNNFEGQLGDGTTIDKHSPIQTSTPLNVWLSVGGGPDFSVGLKSNGTLWAWGGNYYGQLGVGDTTKRISPIQIGTDNKWISISVGWGRTLGLKSDGTLWAWGENYLGQLGDGTTTQRNSPVQVGTDTKWVSIAAGGDHSLGLKSDGTLCAWGYNSIGQLGDGTTMQSTCPIQIGASNNWTSIAAGGDHSLGLKSDGSLWAWGWNGNGELGDGTTIDRHSPVQIGIDTKWVSITTGYEHSLGLKSDGTLWAWGRNIEGQLGDGTNIDKNNPVQIGTDNKWTCITGGRGYHTLGLKSDGTLWAWGWNSWGQLGDGTIIDKSNPLQIGINNNWVNIAAGCFHSLGLKSDRKEFCATGLNSSRQLGMSSGLFDSNNKPYSNNFACTTNCYPPSIPIGTNATVCAYNTANLSATGSGTLSWYTQATGGIYLGAGTNYTTPTLTASTTYYVQDSSCAGSVTGTTINVNVNPIPIVTTSLNGTIITANQNGASYQWFDCNNGNAIIPGQTNQSYTATTNGNYAVILTMNGCTDVSACVNVNSTGINNLIKNNNQLTVYPNPSNDVFTVQSTSEGVYWIINELGNTIQNFKLNATNNYTTNVSNLSNGIYFIVGFNDNQIIRQKIVVTK